ncbi:MAG: GNAT family N-acetyltransferase [Acidimicrobiia bacterium]
MSPVRPGVASDLISMQDIERSASERFREVGMPEIADDEPAPLAELQQYVVAGRAWVLTDADDRAVAYVLVDVIDGNAHIEQLSVDSEHQRQGLGRALVDHVATWARAGGMPAVTLTTFHDVPWNGPYYERLGFRTLADAELTPGLVELHATEAAHGLDPDARVCMRLELG